ncbi:hypothetical protein [Microvirga sp. Mcv34]|uniref:hypothetical protein n=1 Tax=Microvirga sp. Mcv34 TaxID=2926016 RepID=UPI0021C842CB|nr:hypothetical protein [Microvirga sp. Mcv34]
MKHGYQPKKPSKEPKRMPRGGSAVKRPESTRSSGADFARTLSQMATNFSKWVDDYQKESAQNRREQIDEAKRKRAEELGCSVALLEILDAQRKEISGLTGKVAQMREQVATLYRTVGNLSSRPLPEDLQAVLAEIQDRLATLEKAQPEAAESPS